MTDKEYKDYSVDEIIETMFKTFFVNDNILHPRQIQQDAIYEFGFGSNKTEGAIKKLITYDIIDIDNNRTISLTKEGHKVVKLGSWTAYLKRQDNWFLKDNWANLKWIGTTLIAIASLAITILNRCK